MFSGSGVSIQMGKRGPATFKRNDAIRAIESAREGGIEPVMVEVVVAKDGDVSFRVYAADAVTMPTPTPDGTREVRSAAEWDAEIKKTKGR